MATTNILVFVVNCRTQERNANGEGSVPIIRPRFYKNGVVLQTNARVAVSGSVLTFSPFLAQDQGFYQCSCEQYKNPQSNGIILYADKCACSSRGVQSAEGIPPPGISGLVKADVMEKMHRSRGIRSAEGTPPPGISSLQNTEEMEGIVRLPPGHRASDLKKVGELEKKAIEHQI
jgi:hypothetical protein